MSKYANKRRKELEQLLQTASDSPVVVEYLDGTKDTLASVKQLLQTAIDQLPMFDQILKDMGLGDDDDDESA